MPRALIRTVPNELDIANFQNHVQGQLLGNVLQNLDRLELFGGMSRDQTRFNESPN